LDVYLRYVNEFPRPIEPALETRFKIAEIRKAAHDETRYRQELTDIVRIDAEAGSERTDRTRTLAARSALVLAEQLYGEFVAVKLSQPFETSFQNKKQRMDAAIEAMSGLVAYEIADVTAAATFYMAETYLTLSRVGGVSGPPTCSLRRRKRTSWPSRRKRSRSRRRPSACTRRTWNCCKPASSTRGPRRVSASSAS
jgi:hypothetical protein